MQLVVASPQLHKQCEAAANRIGFAVPCPRDVPQKAGRAMTCPAPIGAMTMQCVGAEGETAYPVFFLDFAGFDVPDDYVGVDGQPVGHMFLEARRHANSPARPCIAARDLGVATIGHRAVTSYDCSDDANTVEGEARHGEGANLGHTLVTWSQGGIDYIASAHGHTAVNRALLRRLVASIALIPPT